MFWRHEINVPPGFEAVVNGRIEPRKPLRVGTYDQVYFVNFAPFFAEISAQAACREGIVHDIDVVVRLECERSNPGEVLRDSGNSTYRNIVKVSVSELATRQNLIDSIQAAIQTFTQAKGMFELTALGQVREELHEKIAGECVSARLRGEVVSCQVVALLPEPELLAQLAARAGITDVVSNEARTREYANPTLGAIVEYFFETLRQSELIQAETELAKAEAERARVEAQKQISIARADVKLVELEQGNRIATLQAELQTEEAQRQQGAQQRNAAIKEGGAAYEFAYKSKRLEEDMALAQKELEVARVRNEEEAALRKLKRLDLQLELDRERELARIRAEEKAGLLTLLGGLVEKLGGIPAADYRGVHTLVTGAASGPGESKEFATGLVLGLLSRAAEGVSGPNPASERERSPE